MQEGQAAEQFQFGSMLRDWRQTRRLSQLELALASDVSARHISFLETGRARPSRTMVVHLAEFLGVPHAARNTLLNAAGFAPAYRAHTLDDAAMRPVEDAMNWMLQRHAPYPAMVLDRHWSVIRANPPATMMLAAVGVGAETSLLTLFADPARLEAMIDNWEEVARHMALRLRTEAAHFGSDDVLLAAARRLEAGLPRRGFPKSGTRPPLVSMRIRLGGATLSLFSTISQFGTAEDIALADYKMELFFPADGETREALIALGSA